RQHAVVAPAAGAGKSCHRHELDGRDAEAREVLEPCRHPGKGTLGTEGSNVQLVDDRLGPGRGAPQRVIPGEGARIDDLARPVHALRVAARGGIGDLAHAIEPIAVAAAGAGRSGLELEPPAAERAHRQRLRAATWLRTAAGLAAAAV